MNKPKKRVQPTLISSNVKAAAPPKKRVQPTLISNNVGAASYGEPAKKRSGGHKRIESNVNGTVKQMKQAIKEHNDRYCIKTTGTKSAIKARMERVAKRFRDIEKKGGGAKGGLTEGQQKANKELNKIAKKYGKLTQDANPELAF